MSSNDELLAVLGEQTYRELSDVSEVLLASHPGSSQAAAGRPGAELIAGLSGLLAEKPRLVDAAIDDSGAHLTFSNGATLHAEIDRALVGVLVDPALSFTFDAFWCEEGRWILLWASADDTATIELSVAAASVTRNQHH